MAEPRLPRIRKPANDLTAQYVRSIMDYDPYTGVFTWRWRSDAPYPWNRRLAGKRAGCIDDRGYLLLRINDRLYLGHRVVWLVMTNEWPADEIDHKDGNRSNNTWENLREAGRLENGSNLKMNKKNTSGFKGVCWHKQMRKWDSRIMKNHRYIRLGFFDSKEAAYEAYQKAAAELFGEFVREEEHL